MYAKYTFVASEMDIAIDNSLVLYVKSVLDVFFASVCPCFIIHGPCVVFRKTKITEFRAFEKAFPFFMIFFIWWHLTRNTIGVTKSRQMTSYCRIMRMYDAGILGEWYRKVEGTWTGCVATGGGDHGPSLEPLHLEDLEGLFYIALMGQTVALLVLMLEFGFYSYHNKHLPRKATRAQHPKNKSFSPVNVSPSVVQS